MIRPNYLGEIKSRISTSETALFGEKPRFEEITNAMAQLEKEINISLSY